MDVRADTDRCSALRSCSPASAISPGTKVVATPSASSSAFDNAERASTTAGWNLTSAWTGMRSPDSDNASTPPRRCPTAAESPWPASVTRRPACDAARMASGVRPTNGIDAAPETKGLSIATFAESNAFRATSNVAAACAKSPLATSFRASMRADRPRFRSAAARIVMITESVTTKATAHRMRRISARGWGMRGRAPQYLATRLREFHGSNVPFVRSISTGSPRPGPSRPSVAVSVSSVTLSTSSVALSASSVAVASATPSTRHGWRPRSRHTRSRCRSRFEGRSWGMDIAGGRTLSRKA